MPWGHSPSQEKRVTQEKLPTGKATEVGEGKWFYLGQYDLSNSHISPSWPTMGHV